MEMPSTPPSSAIDRGLNWLIRAAASRIDPSGSPVISSTKLVWLTNGMLSCYCATLATIAGVSVYLFLGKADAIYWTAAGALWVNALGFASTVQKNSHNVTKEITLAQGDNQAASS